MVIVLFLAVSLFLPDILVMLNEELSFEMRAAAAEKIITLHSRVWPAIIAMVCVLGIHSVRIFHRLIGPLYRFRWAFAKLGQGDLSFRVNIRKSDYLHQERDAFNEMIISLAEKCESIQLAGGEALESLVALEQAATEVNSWRETDQQLLRKHGQELKNLVDQIQYFHLRADDKVEQEES
jgi:methyl-accepting chemotaxis protein